jgi:hypothetical protein
LVLRYLQRKQGVAVCHLPQEWGGIRIKRKCNGSSNIAPGQTNVLQCFVAQRRKLGDLPTVFKYAQGTGNQLPGKSENRVVCDVCHGVILL